MKKLLFFAAVVICMATLHSCTQESDVDFSVENNAKAVDNMRDLTEQLKAYDAQFIRVEQIPVRLPGGVTFSKLDYARLAITDVCGGIRGASAGFIGIVGGAVGSSLWKGCKMYASKYLILQLKNQIRKSPIATYDGNVSYQDSIGFFHNTIEYELYQQNSNSHMLPMSDIVSAANDRMMEMSSNYRRSGGMTQAQINSLAEDLDVIKDVDTSLSYKEYFAKLKELYPENADIIDFCAEYIYTMLYANVDVDIYTREVLYMVKKSNLDISDREIAYRGIQIAYASILFSQGMTYIKMEK